MGAVRIGRRWIPRAGLAVLALALIAGCEPTSPPPGAGTAAPSAPPDGAPVPSAGTSTVTVDGTTITIVGAGNGTTDLFDLPAGTADMTVSACESSQVIPFVTIFDGDDNKLGLIVEPIYQMRNLEGGQYYLGVAANPDCVWTITITPG